MNSESYRFTLGTFDCLIAVSDGSLAYPTDWVFANAPAERLQQELPADSPSPEQVTIPYTCLLVDTGQHRVLVDTGAGALAPSTGKLLANLRAEGILPEDIDTVILTHGHADHIGGTTAGDGRPAFPRARYMMWQAEWDFWTADTPNLAALDLDDQVKHLLVTAAHASLPPLRGHLDLVDREREIVPGIHAVAAPGHTPGHMALAIASGSQQLLHIADTVLHPLHMEHPDWYPRFDLLKDEAAASKRRLLGLAAADDALTLAFHFPFPSLGYVRPRGTGWRWQPIAPAG